MGDEANLYFDTCRTIRTKLKKLDFQEVYPPYQIFFLWYCKA